MPEPQPAAEGGRRSRYAAFISYKRDVDLKIASALQTGLQRLATPWYRLPAIRICRDKTDLVVNPGLWSAIQHRLDDSDHLILLASPEAVSSPWVEREVADWIARRSPDKVLIVLTAGEISWDSGRMSFDAAKTTALPESMRSIFSEEPSYLDLRWAREVPSLSLKEPSFRDAIAEVLARLTGREKAEVLGEDLRQQRRALRLAWSAVAALVVLASAALVAAWFAVRQRQVAEEQRTVAIARQLMAQSRLVAAERPAGLDRSALLAIEGAKKFASIEADQTLRQSAGLLSTLETTITEDGPVTRLAISPSGRYIATSTSNNSARLWDLQERREVARFRHDGDVNAVTFSADGQWVVTASRDGTAIIWDGTTGAQVVRVQHEPVDVHLELLTEDGGSQPYTERRRPSVDAVAISVDRRYLATASAYHTARVWELPGGRQLLRAEHGSLVTAVAFSPDGLFLATAGHDKLTRVWALADGREVQRFPHADRVECVAYSSDGRRLASGGFDHTARVWDLDGRLPPLVLRHDGPVTSIVFSQSGELIATAAWDSTARLWEAASGRELSRTQHQGAVRAVAFSRDERRLLTASEDGTGRLVEIPSGQEIARVVHENSVNDIAFSLDGRSIVTASSDSTVRVWSATGGSEALRVLHEGRGGNEQIERLAFRRRRAVLRHARSRVRQHSQIVGGFNRAGGRADATTERLWHRRGDCLRKSAHLDR
jgi:WD40 repeat protein